MKNIIPVKFKDCSSLVEDLKKKSKDFPLIAKLYIPVIEKHVKNHEKDYDNLVINFDDWLIIPYFQYLWNIEDSRSKGELGKKEIFLSLVYDNLGEDKFEEMCLYLVNEHAIDDRIFEISNKILDFDSELRGMLHYINEGYKVERIKRKDDKTPDFKAFKENEEIFVECKFIRKPNSVQYYLEKYYNMQKAINSKNNIGSIFDPFSYSMNPKEPSNKEKFDNVIKQLKKNGISKKSVDIQIEMSVEYNPNKEIGLGLVTINVQRDCIINKLLTCFSDCLESRIEDANNQLEKYEGKNKGIFIFIELENLYSNCLVDKKSLRPIIKKIINDFEKSSKDTKIIVEFFPDILSCEDDESIQFNEIEKPELRCEDELLEDLLEKLGLYYLYDNLLDEFCYKINFPKQLSDNQICKIRDFMDQIINNKNYNHCLEIEFKTTATIKKNK